MDQIKWFINKDLHTINEYITLLYVDQSINNLELILFCISYFSIIYIIYYKPWIIIYPFTLIIK